VRHVAGWFACNQQARREPAAVAEGYRAMDERRAIKTLLRQ